MESSKEESQPHQQQLLAAAKDRNSKNIEKKLESEPPKPSPESSKTEKDRIFVPIFDRAEKTEPSGGRESSYIFNVLDKTENGPDPTLIAVLHHKGSQTIWPNNCIAEDDNPRRASSSFDLDASSSTSVADIAKLRKDSSELYKEELHKLLLKQAKSGKFSALAAAATAAAAPITITATTTPADNVSIAKSKIEKSSKTTFVNSRTTLATSAKASKTRIANDGGKPIDERNREFCLLEDIDDNNRDSADQLLPPPSWIPIASPEAVEANLRSIITLRDAIRRVADERQLATKFGLEFDRNRRLHANKQHAFYRGRRRVATIDSNRNESNEPVLIKAMMLDTLPPPSLQLSAPTPPSNVARSSSSSSSLSANRTGFNHHHPHNRDVNTFWINAYKLISSKHFVAPTASPTGNDRDNNRKLFARLYDAYYLESNGSILLSLEIAPRKSMHWHVKRRRSIRVCEARRWSAQLLDAITAIANHGVAHRSIRLEHILLDSCDNIRLIGWRRATPLTAPSGVIGWWWSSSPRRERRIRRNNHMPPEAFCGAHDPAGIDLWSWGVAVCAICTFRYPFNVMATGGGGGGGGSGGKSGPEAAAPESQWSAFKARHKRSCANLFCATLDPLFITDPDKRCTIENIRKSAFFTTPTTTATSLTKVTPTVSVAAVAKRKSVIKTKDKDAVMAEKSLSISSRN